jgi:hypothetical protein
MDASRFYRCAIMAMIAFLTTLYGCGGGDAGSAEPVDDPRSASPTKRMAPPSATAADEAFFTSSTIVFHLTGLLLVVRPKTSGDSVEVLLPNVAGHEARLGIGVDTLDIPGPQGFCDNTGFDPADPPVKKGICYVNLRDWDLEPFGDGGQPLPTVGQPIAGLIDLTTLTGGYKVRLPVADTLVRARVTLTAGDAVLVPCFLASYRPNPSSSSRTEVANVLHWTIRSPTSDSLVFRRGAERIAVALPRSATGVVDLILAHVPFDDLRDLPPVRPRNKPNPVAATHFPAYYDLLLDPRPVPAAARHTLSSGRVIQTECDVPISRWRQYAHDVDQPNASPRTFSCMLASAQRT